MIFNFVFSLFTACVPSMHCATCTAMITECSSCATDAAELRYLRDTDKACVTEIECNEAEPYHWDGLLLACTCKNIS